MTNRYDTSQLPEDQYEPGSDGAVLRDGVFTWAGAYRTVNIGKEGFMFAATAHVPEMMRQFERD